ncbi:hypothetical protein MKX01_019501 [Papaver californicum]|nr:hypothetical protein MKX01_019501 [Papaver californicum]
MEKIFESPIYLELQSLVKSFDRQTVLKIKQLITLVPKTAKVFSYQINWDVVDKHELHTPMNLEGIFWISNNVKNTTEEFAESIVHSLQINIFNKFEAECFLLKMWTILIFKIKNNLSKTFDVYIFKDMVPKTIEELLSFEINWAVYDEHELHKTMKAWMTKEILELLKRKQRLLWLIMLLKLCWSCFSPFWRTILKWFHRHISVATPNREMLDGEREKHIDAIPGGIKELLSYDIDWAMSDKINLDNTLKPWISSEIAEFVRSKKDAATLVDSTVSIIKDHSGASALLELLKPILGIDRSQRFLQGLWTHLIFGIMSTGKEYDHVPIPYPQLDEERGIRKQFGDRYSRSRHYFCELKRVNETMPKTKEELFSCNINWDVYNKHELHATRSMTLELIRQKEEAGLAEDEIVWSIFNYHASASQREFITQGKDSMVVDLIMPSLSEDRVSASQMTELLQPILGHGSEKFVMRMWHALTCGIKLLEACVKQKSISWRCPVLLVR